MMTEAQPTGSLLTERHDDVLVMTINRPHVRNAIDADVFAGLIEGFALLDADDDLRVGILTGAGGTFSAGMDLRAFADGEPMTGAYEILRGDRPAKPLIAAIEGFAVAGGLETALVADLLVAADDARFGFPEVRRGLIAGGGGLVRLTHRAAYHHAMELALTGEMVGAARAYEMGLVNRLTPPGEALARAHELARTIAANAPLAVAASKALIQAGADENQAQLWERQDAVLARITSSDDALEGARAFLEKRAPAWSGR